MNPIALQKIVSDAINQNVFENWRFYLLLISLAFLTTLFSARIEGWSKRKGETAATKDDLEEIKRQLAETTKVTKTVETAIVRGDWIQRERNTQKRTKLEETMRAAFSIAGWARDIAPTFFASGDIEHPSALNDFQMLTKLYFPELANQTTTFNVAYIEFVGLFTQIRLELIGMDNEINIAQGRQDLALVQQLRDKKTAFGNSCINRIATAENSIRTAVDQFGNAAYEMMNRLTSDH